MASDLVMVPGIGGSGPDHWQSHWERSWPGARRMAPASWDEPDLTDWIAALDRAVSSSTVPPVLICHSLGCLLFAHWRAASATPIAAALLVAVPDPAGPAFPPQATAFGSLTPVAFGERPVLAVASSNDPYDPQGGAIAWAEAAGAMPRRIGPHGHLNAASGLGDWPEGQAILRDMLSTVGA